MAKRRRKVHQTELMRRLGGGIYAKIGPAYGHKKPSNRGRKTR